MNLKLSIRTYSGAESGFWKVITIIDVVLLLSSLLYLLFKGSQYWQYIILSIEYIALHFLLKNRLLYIGPGVKTLYIVSTFRYMLMPFVIISANDVSQYHRNLSYLLDAVGVIAFEMFAIAITLLLYHPKYNYEKNDYRVSLHGIRKLFFVLLVATVIVLYIDNNALTGNFQILSGTANTTMQREFEQTSGAISIIWQASCAFIFVYIIYLIYDSTSNGKLTTNLAVNLSVLLCFLYYTVIFTGQMEISRWYMIVSVAASVMCLLKFYPKQRMSIIIKIGIPVLILLIVATLVKILGNGASSITFTEMIKSIFTADSMESYFAGPVNVNNAIELQKSSSIGFTTAFYDILNNFPYVNSLIDRSQSSANLYNDFINRTDQIIPLVGQSKIWFGTLFSPLMSVVAVILMKHFDTKFIYTTDMFAYVYAFLAVWCALMPILNFTIWLSWIYLRIIPLLLLFYCTGFRVKKNKVY